MNESQSITAIIKQQFKEAVISAHQFRDQETAVIKSEFLLEVAGMLRDEAGFDVLTDLTCVDYLAFGKSQASRPRLSSPSPRPYYMSPMKADEAWGPQADGGEFRFEVVYHFYSTSRNRLFRLKVPIGLKGCSVSSLTGLWNSANWFEREVWDMFGVRFTGHPNLRRILLYEQFSGHPLRKDYPVDKRQPLIGPVN